IPSRVRRAGSLRSRPKCRGQSRSILRRHQKTILWCSTISGKALRGAKLPRLFGIGDDHCPLPWQSLKYDAKLSGYRTSITEQQLRGAPKSTNDNAWDCSDRSRIRAVDDYYGALPIAG